MASGKTAISTFAHLCDQVALSPAVALRFAPRPAQIAPSFPADGSCEFQNSATVGRTTRKPVVGDAVLSINGASPVT